MNCCTNCFSDPEIIGFIQSNSTVIGQCQFCKCENVQIIEAKDLGETFEPVISLFKTIAELKITVPNEELLFQKLQANWNIFNIPDEQVIQSLLANIVSESHTADTPLLTTPVELEARFNPILRADQHESKWTSFAEEIKFKNRFFLTETIDLPLLANLLENFSTRYDVGAVFYRARVSTKLGFNIKDMGKPPIEKAASGRANPIGIPYLYVATTQETAVYESRPSFLDYITIAELHLNKALHIIRLREITALSPFIFGEHIENYIIHQKYLYRLEQELSKPVRRFDKELDYLPSQYLCEYVKSLGYDAIEYSSALKFGGINLAIFNEEKLDIVKSEVVEISNVDLDFNHVVK